jgi:hypothetical protein
MKKLTIATLLATTTLFMVGCFSTSEEATTVKDKKNIIERASRNSDYLFLRREIKDFEKILLSGFDETPDGNACIQFMNNLAISMTRIQYLESVANEDLLSTEYGKKHIDDIKEAMTELEYYKELLRKTGVKVHVSCTGRDTKKAEILIKRYYDWVSQLINATDMKCSHLRLLSRRTVGQLANLNLTRLGKSSHFARLRKHYETFLNYCY